MKKSVRCIAMLLIALATTAVGKTAAGQPATASSAPGTANPQSAIGANPSAEKAGSSQPAPVTPTMRLPEFNVLAGKTPGELNQIDRDLRREESLSTPTPVDSALNGDRFSAIALFRFGDETAQKRAGDAMRRTDVLRLQRLVSIPLRSADPEEKRRLREDRKAVDELRAHNPDETPFNGMPRPPSLQGIIGR